MPNLSSVITTAYHTINSFVPGLGLPGVVLATNIDGLTM